MIPVTQVASRIQIGLLVFCMTLVGHAQAAERLELDNGIKLLFEPIPGVGQVAIESVYDGQSAAWSSRARRPSISGMSGSWVTGSRIAGRVTKGVLLMGHLAQLTKKAILE